LRNELLKLVTPAVLIRYRVGLGTVEKLAGLSFMTALDDRMHRKLSTECPGTMLH